MEKSNDAGNVQSIGQLFQHYEDEGLVAKPEYKFVNFKFGGEAFQRELVAGPYMQRPEELPGVKLAAEIGAPCAIDLPIPDFKVPDRDQAERAALATIVLMWQGATPYVGCMGGRGRTGVLLGIIAKVALRMSRGFFTVTYPDPVTWVRDAYRPEAIETSEQEEFVRDFNTKWIESMVKHL